jgi:4Fe-4S ferredoxin
MGHGSPFSTGPGMSPRLTGTNYCRRAQYLPFSPVITTARVFEAQRGTRGMTKADPNCRFDPGVMVPMIDPMRCEAKGPCVPICPYDVLVLRTVPPEEKARLPLVGRLKLFVHGGKQAFALNPDACRGCGLCVKACPEKAIKLQKRLP